MEWTIDYTITSITQRTFRSFTQRNFRENLVRLTGLNPSEYHAHHVFPQQFFETHFRDSGINIHAPQYGVWWEATDHLRHKELYNRIWEDFLTTAERSIDEVIDFGRQIMKAFGGEVNF